MDESQIKKEDVMVVYQNIQVLGVWLILYGFFGKIKSMVWGYFGFYMGEDGYFDKLYVICCYCYMVV